MLSSSRALMILLLLGPLAACDRQSQPKEQANAAASGEVAATPGEATPAPGKAEGFNYKVDRSKAGQPMPDFAFLDPEGGEKTLQDFAGRPLIVNLWATWCTPCVAEMPTLDALAARQGAKGAAVLTISQDTQGLTAVKPFFEKHKLPHLPAYADPENRFGFHYATGVLPTTVIYNAQGKEIARVVGAMDWDSAEGRELIAESAAS